MLEEILDRAARGQLLAPSRVRPKLVGAAVRYFGSWKAAIEAADLDYHAIRLVRMLYDDEEIFSGLRDLARRRPRMTLAQLANDTIGRVIANRRWGLRDTVRGAGLTNWPVRVLQDVMSKPELRRALLARHASAKRLTMTAIRHEDPPMQTAIRRHYGSIEAALRDVGLASQLARTTWSRARVLRELKQRRDRGLPLNPRAVQLDFGSRYNAAIKFFGTYWGAAARFGAKPKITRRMRARD